MTFKFKTKAEFRRYLQENPSEDYRTDYSNGWLLPTDNTAKAHYFRDNGVATDPMLGVSTVVFDAFDNIVEARC